MKIYILMHKYFAVSEIVLVDTEVEEVKKKIESEEEIMGRYYNADGKSKGEIMNEFVRICKVGTSRDCRIVVDEARGHGISYEELCEYKRSITQ